MQQSSGDDDDDDELIGVDKNFDGRSIEILTFNNGSYRIVRSPFGVRRKTITCQRESNNTPYVRLRTRNIYDLLFFV